MNKNHAQLQHEVLEVFNKKFNYEKLKIPWCLPKAHELFHEHYEYEELQLLKSKLNHVKSKLNNYNIDHWSQHTRRKDPSSSIIQCIKHTVKAEFVTAAWCKFYECICSFPQMVPNPRLNTLHLCEAPGAFVAALNHYLYSNYKKHEVQWNWLATTLNPYYEGNSYNEMIHDDRFMFSSLDNWLFHTDFTGNIINVQNQTSISEECRTRFPNNGEVHLITADGSVNCMQIPERQEEEVAELNFAEILTALTILSPNGCFLLKMFTLFDASSVCKLFLLHCIFEQVHVYKPSTSKRGNSELYILCMKYQKHTENLPEILRAMQQSIIEKRSNYPLFTKSAIPKDFLIQHEICCRIFMHYQVTAIEDNIASYQLSEKDKERIVHPYMKRLRYMVCKEYYRRCNIQSISDKLKISKQDYDPWFIPGHFGSYAEMQRVKNLTLNDQLHELKAHICRLHQLTENVISQKVSMECSSQKNNVKPIIKIYRGYPIAQLRSSLFVWKDIVEIGIKFQYLYPNIEPFIPQNAKVIMTDECTEINYHNGSSIMTKIEKFSQQQFSFFYNILKIVMHLQPLKIEFHNVPFITHLSVSLLKYLSSYVFENLSICAKSKSILTLQGHRANFIESLKMLHDILKENCCSTQQDNEDILCVLRLQELHRHEFNIILLNFNKKILLDNYYHLIMNAKI